MAEDFGATGRSNEICMKHTEAKREKQLFGIVRPGRRPIRNENGMSANGSNKDRIVE